MTRRARGLIGTAPRSARSAGRVARPALLVAWARGKVLHGSLPVWHRALLGHAYPVDGT